MATIKKVVRSVNEWFLCTVGSRIWKQFTDSLVIQNDEYFVLRDFWSYAERHEAVGPRA